MKLLFPSILAVLLTFSSCYVNRKLAEVKSGGIDSTNLASKITPADYIHDNETFLTYYKDGKMVVAPSNVIKFQLYDKEKASQSAKVSTEKVQKSKTPHKRESCHDRRARRKREKREWKEKYKLERAKAEKPKHESCHAKKERRKREKRELKEKIKLERTKVGRAKHESCHAKRARHKREKRERKAASKKVTVTYNYPKNYAYANMNKYYYRFRPARGVGNFFIAVMTIFAPNLWQLLPQVHERKLLTLQQCKDDNQCKGITYKRKILLEANVVCRRDSIDGAVHIYEDLPAEIKLDGYKVKMRSGKKRIQSVTKTELHKDGKVYYDFAIIPKKGAFKKPATVWVIMNVSVTPLPNNVNVTSAESTQTTPAITKKDTAVVASPVPVKQETPKKDALKPTPVAVKQDTAVAPAPVVVAKTDIIVTPTKDSVKAASSAKQALSDTSTASVQDDDEPVATAKPAVETAKTNQPVAKTEGIGYHVVQHGETLYGIAKQHGVSIDDLKNWNDLSGGLKSGMKLVVSKNADPSTTKTEKQMVPKVPEKQASAGAKYHTVGVSETLYSISRLYRITVQQLMEWNGLKNNNLTVGQQLLVGK